VAARFTAGARVLDLACGEGFGVYSHEHGNDNPFHVRELTEPEFRALLGSSFGHVAVLRQNVAVGSLIVGPIVAEFDNRAFPAGQQGPPLELGDSRTSAARSELADAQRRAQRAEVLAGWQQELAGEADRRAAEQPSCKRRCWRCARSSRPPRRG
jgi:hypothetical protein